ncbi:hypothetical protein B0H16DRAFT_124593 [Mycena metata]|uniref:DNA polymerase lambda n=1 Tax=Mycena metata TaxID=1033252 RepID=A0AAD7I7C2_9AGAR|nr:hypothetical protein B0H16DRAFT_124593 [Mycena metata]
MLERTAKKREKRDEALPRRARQSPKVSAPCHGGTISEDESIISISTSSRPSSPPPIRKLTKPSAKPPPKPKPVVQSKSVPPKKGKKKEKVKMYPKDYAQMLLDQPPDPSAKRRQQFLKGMNIFYTGGDMTWASDATRGRMDLIVQHGGNLFPVFDPALVTHIISETSSPEPMLRALGLKKLGEVPDHIPIVKWNWVVSGQEGALGPLWEFAAYANRIPPIDVPVRSGKGKERAIVADQSRISAKQRKRSIHDSEDEEDDERQGPQVGPLQSPPSSRRLTARTDGPSTSRVKTEAADDPLAEFYAKARFDRDNAWSRHGEAGEDEDETDIDEPASDSDDDTAQKPGPPPPKGGWTCDSKEAQVKNGPNEFIAKKLEELMHLHKAKPGMDNHWRAFSYTKALRPIRKHPKPIRSYSEARKIKGVAHKTALKIMEIVETGDLRRIGYENTADVQIRKLFQGIYGVGQQTAYQWYAAGCRSLKDLKAGKGGVTLTPAQKIGIEFYDDINDRMPREEAQALFELIKPIALEINPKLEVEIMGSYRRGKADCGDIDIMITRCPDDGKTHAGILHHLLKALHEKNIITEDLALPEDPFDNEAIYRGLCRLPKFGSRRRRIDFLTVPWKSRGAALLYYTGDDIFNRSMRLKANRLGYSLNQKGLFAGVVRDPRNRTVKTNTGNIVASETEEEIFRMLGVPFQLPHQRVRG